MITQVFALAALVAVVHGGAIGLGGIALGGLDGGIARSYSLSNGIASVQSLGSSIAAPVAIAKQAIVDYAAPANYEFKYGVSDSKTGDNKEQAEVRRGDTVKGEYSLLEPDGTIRIVKYTADPINGFNAIVERKGTAGHPQLLAVQKTVALPALATSGLGLGGGLKYGI